MSDFEEILVTETGVGNGRWKTSKLGPWLYTIDGYLGSNGEIYPSKSKKGNPSQIRVHEENLARFIKHLQDVENLVSGGLGNGKDDIPF